MAKLIVISWRDIPSQVVVKRGRDTAKALLSPRFQQAIDRAAMRAGKGSSDAYLADWRRAPPRECADDMEAQAVAEAARLEARYSNDDLTRLVRAHGDDVNVPKVVAPEASRDAALPSTPGTPTGVSSDPSMPAPPTGVPTDPSTREMP